MEAESVASVPLTFSQRARLFKECLPVVFFGAVTIALPWLLNQLNGSRPPMLLMVFLVGVFLVCLLTAIRRMRDLTSGVAIVKYDRLSKSWSSRRGPQHWGQFEQLGRLRLTPRAHGTGRPGARNRLTYSPVSKIVWTLEPIE